LVVSVSGKGGFIRQVFTGETNELESLFRCRKYKGAIKTGGSSSSP
jgi:hypothetical protein